MLKFRFYECSHDYKPVNDFLIKHYQPGNRDGNWIKRLVLKRYPEVNAGLKTWNEEF
jgi:hypothetical protein